MKRAVVLLFAGLLITGCRSWVEPPAKAFRGENLTGQTIIVRPRTPDRLLPPMTVRPGEPFLTQTDPDTCEFTPWVAVTESGQVLAEISGACDGHWWSIRGLNDSTYE
jgi:hypothetical protein